jgi:hypothetical protein
MRPLLSGYGDTPLPMGLLWLKPRYASCSLVSKYMIITWDYARYALLHPSLRKSRSIRTALLAHHAISSSIERQLPAPHQFCAPPLVHSDCIDLGRKLAFNCNLNSNRLSTGLLLNAELLSTLVISRVR